jgi:hypothetical protein
MNYNLINNSRLCLKTSEEGSEKQVVVGDFNVDLSNLVVHDGKGDISIESGIQTMLCSNGNLVSKRPEGSFNLAVEADKEYSADTHPNSFLELNDERTYDQNHVVNKLVDLIPLNNNEEMETKGNRQLSPPLVERSWKQSQDMIPLMEDDEIDSWSSSNSLQSICLDKSEIMPVKTTTRKIDSSIRKLVKNTYLRPEQCKDCAYWVNKRRECKCTGFKKGNNKDFPKEDTQGKRIKVLRKLKNQMNRLLKTGKISMVYWTIDGKAYESLPDVVEFVLNGYHAKANWRLKGGMKEDVIDILDPKNHKLNVSEDALEFTIPNPPPTRLKVPTYIQKVMRDTKSITVKPMNQTAYVVKQNGLTVKNLRNRELYSRDQHRDNSKIAKNQVQNILNNYMSNHNDTPKDVQSVYNPNMQYAASRSLTTKDDPDWKECPHQTKFEDQLQYARYTLTKNDVPCFTLNPLTQQNILMLGIPDHINIMTLPSLKVSNYYCPTPQDYNSKYDYACRIVDGFIMFAFPYQGNYLKVAYPNSMRQLVDTYFIFNHYRVCTGEELFHEVYIEVKTKDGMIKVPKYMIEYAQEKFGSKNLSGYSISTFIAEFQKFWKNSANSVFEEPTQEMIQSAMMFAATEKHMNLQDQLGLNYQLLNVQAENVKLLANLPKYTGVYGFLKKIAEMIVPDGFRDIVLEMFNNWKFTGINVNLEPIKQIFEDGVAFLFSLFVKVPLMNVFPQLNDILGVFLEELIKMLPGGGIVIAIYEIYQDWKKGHAGILDSLIRILFHNWHELLPFWLRVCTFPLRVGFHYGWNQLKKKAFAAFDRVVNKIEETYASSYERKPELGMDFMVIDRTFRQARFPRSESVPIPDCLVMNPVLDMEVDDTESLANPIYTVAASVSSNMAGMKNGNNFLNAYLKRNIQEKPLKKLRYEEVVMYKKTASMWKECLDIKECDTQTWINLPNHGSKRMLYQSAYNEFLNTGEINFTAKLNLKLDEVVFKKLMRTICAFDNSYLINVAPAIAEYSSALKRFFNGYNNVAKPTDPFTLHVLYATGMTTKEMAKVIYDNRCMVSENKPHFFLAVLGDDTALTQGDTAMCCDFSRYDSTQHEEQHEAFREMMLCENNVKAIFFMRKAAQAPTKVQNPQTGERYTVPTTGLKTGCPETSVSNTTITAISVYLALLDSFPDEKCEKWKTQVPKWLEERAGFLPKASIQNLQTGVEFLKNIFILQYNDIVVVPLLSSLAKVGKFLTHPRLIVPFAKLKSHQQICVESVYMQLLGKGDLSKVPGFSKWLNSLAKKSLTNAVYRTQYQTKFDSNEVHHDTMETAYNTRYGLDLVSVLELFDNLSKMQLEDYPFNYTAQVLNVAVEKDYGIEF